jgi:hypothetical protein
MLVGTMAYVAGLGLFVGVTWHHHQPTTLMLPSAPITLPLAATPIIIDVEVTIVL